MKLATLTITDTTPIADVRVYTEAPDQWALSGFTDIRRRTALLTDLGQLPQFVIVDDLDTTSPDEVVVIERVKSSITHTLMVSYSAVHEIVHNADLVHWLGGPALDTRTG